MVLFFVSFIVSLQSKMFLRGECFLAFLVRANGTRLHCTEGVYLHTVI